MIRRRLCPGRSIRSKPLFARVLTECQRPGRVYVLKHLTPSQEGGADKAGAIQQRWQGGHAPATVRVTEFSTARHDGFGRHGRHDRAGVSAPFEAQASRSSGGGTQVSHPARKCWFPGRSGEPAFRRWGVGRLSAKSPQGDAAPGCFQARGADGCESGCRRHRVFGDLLGAYLWCEGLFAREGIVVGAGQALPLAWGRAAEQGKPYPYRVANQP